MKCLPGKRIKPCSGLGTEGLTIDLPSYLHIVFPVASLFFLSFSILSHVGIYHDSYFGSWNVGRYLDSVPLSVFPGHFSNYCFYFPGNSMSIKSSSENSIVSFEMKCGTYTLNYFSCIIILMSTCMVSWLVSLLFLLHFETQVEGTSHEVLKTNGSGSLFENRRHTLWPFLWFAFVLNSVLWISVHWLLWKEAGYSLRLRSDLFIWPFLRSSNSPTLQVRLGANFPVQWP